MIVKMERRHRIGKPEALLRIAFRCHWSGREFCVQSNCTPKRRADDVSMYLVKGRRSHKGMCVEEVKRLDNLPGFLLCRCHIYASDLATRMIGKWKAVDVNLFITSYSIAY